MVQASSVILAATVALYAASPALGAVVPTSTTIAKSAKPTDKVAHDRFHDEHLARLHEQDRRPNDRYDDRRPNNRHEDRRPSDRFDQRPGSHSHEYGTHDREGHKNTGRLGEQHDRLHPSQGYEREHRLGGNSRLNEHERLGMHHEADSRLRPGHQLDRKVTGPNRLHEQEREHQHGPLHDAKHPLEHPTNGRFDAKHDIKHPLTGKKLNGGDPKKPSRPLPSVPAHGLDKNNLAVHPPTSKTPSLKKPNLKVNVPDAAALRNKEINKDFSDLERLMEQQRYRRQESQEPMSPATPETPLTPDSAIASGASGVPAHKHKKHGHKHGKHSHKHHHHKHHKNSSASSQSAVAEPASPMDPSMGAIQQQQARAYEGGEHMHAGHKHHHHHHQEEAAPESRSFDDDELLELVSRAFYEFYDDLD